MSDFMRKEALPRRSAVEKSCYRVVIAEEGVVKSHLFTKTDGWKNKGEINRRGPLARAC